MTTRLEPEDPKAVRQRDRAPRMRGTVGSRTRRDTSGHFPRKTGVQGNPADMPKQSGWVGMRPGSNAHLDQIDRHGAADPLAGRSLNLGPRAAAWSGGQQAPACVREVLLNPSRYRHFFTPLQWQILETKYGAELDQSRTDSEVAQDLELKQQNVSVYRADAERTATELIDTYVPTLAKWHQVRGDNAQLTDEEQAVLKLWRGRDSRQKKGRSAVTPDRTGLTERQQTTTLAAMLDELEATAQRQLNQNRAAIAASRSKEQQEWSGERSVEHEQALEQAVEAREWKSGMISKSVT